MRLVAVLAAACVIAGCAPQFDIGGGDWTKTDTQIQQTTLDEMECARIASRAYWTPDLIVGGLVDVGRYYVENAQMTSAFSRCMESKGYQTVRRS